MLANINPSSQGLHPRYSCGSTSPTQDTRAGGGQPTGTSHCASHAGARDQVASVLENQVSEPHQVGEGGGGLAAWKPTAPPYVTPSSSSTWEPHATLLAHSLASSNVCVNLPENPSS